MAINIPDSGTATIRYNYIQKGPKTGNTKAVIAIGEESPWNKGGRVNPSRGSTIEGNVFQNDNNQKTKGLSEITGIWGYHGVYAQGSA